MIIIFYVFWESALSITLLWLAVWVWSDCKWVKVEGRHRRQGWFVWCLNLSPGLLNYHESWKNFLFEKNLEPITNLMCKQSHSLKTPYLSLHLLHIPERTSGGSGLLTPIGVLRSLALELTAHLFSTLHSVTSHY